MRNPPTRAHYVVFAYHALTGNVQSIIWSVASVAIHYDFIGDIVYWLLQRGGVQSRSTANSSLIRSVKSLVLK